MLIRPKKNVFIFSSENSPRGTDTSIKYLIMGFSIFTAIDLQYTSDRHQFIEFCCTSLFRFLVDDFPTANCVTVPSCFVRCKQADLIVSFHRAQDIYKRLIYIYCSCLNISDNSILLLFYMST